MSGILLIDKPSGWTSHDVVAKLRGIFHERRIGHSGTLDPMATGLLVVFLGRATRAVEFAEADEKEYEAGLRLGMTTDTQDTTGTVLRQTDTVPDEAALRAALAYFRGDIQQIPPMYSAIKLGGKKLYELARKGVEAERTPRQITVRGLELTGQLENGDYTLRICCSKGTYIRTLCHDLGERLGCGGCMSSLRRTRAGVFTSERSHSLEEVQAAENPAEFLLPVDGLFSDFPPVYLPNSACGPVRNGNSVPLLDGPEGKCRVYGPDGEFLMLGCCEAGRLKTIKSFFEV